MLIQNNYFCEDSFSILKVKKRKLKIFFFGISKRAGKNQNQHANCDSFNKKAKNTGDSTALTALGDFFLKKCKMAHPLIL